MLLAGLFFSIHGCSMQRAYVSTQEKVSSMAARLDKLCEMYVKLNGKDLSAAAAKGSQPKVKPAAAITAPASTAQNGNGNVNPVKKESPYAERKLPNFKREPSSEGKKESLEVKRDVSLSTVKDEK